eukprot:3903854-Alexandrium_andersonii.AAC.1
MRAYVLRRVGAYQGFLRPTGFSRADCCGGPARAEPAQHAQPWQAHRTNPPDWVLSAVNSPSTPC